MSAGVSNEVIQRHVRRIKRNIERKLPGRVLGGVNVCVGIDRASNGEVAIITYAHVEDSTVAAELRNRIGPFWNTAFLRWE